jgi:hypothetical protein
MRRLGRFLSAVMWAMGAWGCGHGGSGARARTPAPAPVAPANAPPVATASSHEEVASQILTALGDHDFDAVEREFDENMRRDVPKEKLSRVWSGTVATHGELVSWRLVNREDMNDYEQLLYELKLENGNLEALVMFGHQGSKAAGLYIRSSANR